MDNKNNRVNQILAHLAGAASSAASGVSDAVHSAGQAIGEKYDSVKLNFELSRLHDDQEKLFADIGRTMYLIQSGAFSTDSDATASLVDAQQTIDTFLLNADQKQQDIDLAADRLNKLNGSKVCPVCAKISTSKDVFCSTCGARLPQYED